MCIFKKLLELLLCYIFFCILGEFLCVCITHICIFEFLSAVIAQYSTVVH